MLSTLFINETIPFFVLPEIGRFYPLDGYDLNIISSLFGVSANAFYLFCAFYALVLIFCLYKSLYYFLHSKIYSLLWILLLLFSPAFATSFLRLFVPEKLESVFFAIFIYSFIKFYSTNKIYFFILSLISANFALYYKEVAFIMLGIFAFFHLLFSYKQNNKKMIYLDLLLIFSCIIWLLCYYLFVIINKTSIGYYGDNPYNAFIVFLKHITNYTLNDPFLFVGIFSLLFFRLYLILSAKSKINPILDSMIIASVVHSLAYFVLNMYAFHYPLPAYIFAILPLAFYFKEYYKNLFIKIFFYLCIFIFVFNQFPAFLYTFNHYKAVPNNFQNTITFLDKYIKDNPNTNIYLDGVNRASSGEVYHSFIQNLEFLGNKDFDFKSDLPIDNILLGVENPASNYSVFRSNEVINKKSGDIVIFTPYSTEILDSSKYELLFESSYGFNLPLLGIKSILKSIVLKKYEGVLQSGNVFALPIYFSVYKVK